MPKVDAHLLLIRQLFDSLAPALSVEAAAARMSAVLTMDLCVDLTLNAIVRYAAALPVGVKPLRNPRQDRARPELWEAADLVARTKLPGGLPHMDELKHLHEVRNLTQHAGSIPSGEEIRRYHLPVSEFLKIAYQGVFSLNFREMAVWHLVESNALRSLLEDASYAIDLGHFNLAVGACQIADQRIVRSISAWDLGTKLSPPIGFRSTDDHGRTKQAIGTLIEAIQDLRIQMVALGVGMPMADILRFQQCAAGIKATEAGGGKVYLYQHLPRTDDELSKEASFMLDYLARLALLLEDTYRGIFASVSLEIRFRDQQLWAEEVASDATTS